MTDAPRVLVVADDPSTRRELSSHLTRFQPMQAAGEIAAAGLAAACRPDLIVLEMRDGSGAATLARLRRDFRTALTPVLYVVDETPPDVVGGADDYVVPPFAGSVARRADFALRRAAALYGVNPLSGLAGNTMVDAEIGRRLEAGERFSCLYIDLDNFKAFNDENGFARGDDLIRSAGRCVLAVLAAEPPGTCFVGHLGGDDFVVLLPLTVAEAVAEAIIARFDETNASTCTMSIGVVSGDRAPRTTAEVAESAAQMKRVAKREPRSAWAATGSRR